jgi:hypothetical protein
MTNTFGTSQDCRSRFTTLVFGLLRRRRIVAGPRRFMRVAARLNLAPDVARLAAGAQEVLEAIIVRF